MISKFHTACVSVFLTVLAGMFYACESKDEPQADEGASSGSTNVYDRFNRWTYGAMNAQYLWREDLPDSLECNYDLPPADFFKSLLSDKDRFSYMVNNPYHSRSGIPAGSESSYGYEYQYVAAPDGEIWQYVLYVYGENTRRAGIRRGDLLKSDEAGGVNKAVIRDGVITGVDPHKIMLATDFPSMEKSTVLVDKILELDGRRIGYLCYLEYDSESDLYTPFKKFRDAGIDDLVLDLRFNPGGYVNICRYLCNCIVDEKAFGEIFQQCSYNDRLSRIYEKETGSAITKSYYERPADSYEGMLGVTPLVSLNLKRLFVITTGNTASSSEATIVCLRPYMHVVTIGETSVGKGVGSWTIADSEFVYALQPITMRYYNADMQTTPDTGIIPDHYLPDGLHVSAKELGDPDEPLLGKALSLILPQRNMRMNAKPAGDIALSPVGEPSYIKKFRNKHHGKI